jgi:hypothetical protein
MIQKKNPASVTNRSIFAQPIKVYFPNWAIYIIIIIIVIIT